jgi:signal transduction histidine kinase/DNA-binding response OmpR family regulator/ligand-binding sensor domain-containing protein
MFNSRFNQFCFLCNKNWNLCKFLSAKKIFKNTAKYLVLLILFASNLLSAQQIDYTLEQIGPENGFMGNLIRGITQDTEGKIWIASYIGLISYNGYDFERYKTGKLDETWVTNDIVGINADDQENIWFSTWGSGLQQFKIREKTFNQYKYDENNPGSISGDFVQNTLIDFEGNFWVYCRQGGGLNKMVHGKDLHGEDSIYFIRYPTDSSSIYGLSNGSIWSIDEDGKGNLWIGTSNGLNKLNVRSGKVIKYFNDPNDKTSLLRNAVLKVFFDEEGQLWTGTSDGLSCAKDINNEKLEFIHYQPNFDTLGWFSEKRVWDIINFEENKILFATFGEGPIIFNKKTKKFSNIFYRMLKGRWPVFSLFKDKTGVIWVGAQPPFGLIKITKDRFIHYNTINEHNLTDSTKPGNSNIHFFSAINEKIWIGNDFGVDLYNTEKNIFKHYLDDPFINSGRKTISIDYSGKIWIGSENDGLFYFDNKSDDFKIFDLQLDHINYFDYGGLISKVLADSEKNLWVGVSGYGVIRINLTSGQLNHFVIEGGNSGSYGEFINQIQSIHEDKNGSIWAGLIYGIYKFNSTSNTFDKINSMAVRNTMIDGPEGSILFSSEDNVYSMNLNDNYNIQPFIKNNGLSRLAPFYAMTLDKMGNLWVTTEQLGLWVYEPITKRIQQFSPNHGLQGYFFNRRSILQLDNGMIYVGGKNGINIFDPDEVLSMDKIPLVSILGVNLNSQKENWEYEDLIKDTKIKNYITLPYHVQTVQITFGVMDFHVPELNQYEYKLKNFQEDWVSSSGSNNKATYTNLPHGSYTFLVKGSDSYGTWNEEGASLEIRVLPPPWQSWWAYSLYGLTIIGLLYSIRKYELKRINLRHRLTSEQKEAKRLAELDEIKSNFFANISHEFRTPLTLMLGYIERLKNQVNAIEGDEDIAVLERNTKRVLHLVNQLLDLSKIEAGTLELDFRKYSFTEVVRYITSQFTSLADMKKIKFEIQCEENIELFIDLEKMELVINNLLANAFKFTPEQGTVSVYLRKQPPDEIFKSGSIEFSVSDTGPGISAIDQKKIFDRFYQASASTTRKYEGAGIGLSISKEIVRFHHGKIKVESKLDQGSTFIILLPHGKEHLGKVDDRLVEFKPAEEIIKTKIEKQKFVELSNGISDESKPYILIVEDNEDLQQYLKENLSLKFQVKIAGNGKEGLKLALESIPELIVSDLMMPEMDGYTLCEKIKTDEKTSHIPFIILTAKSDQITKIDSLGIGADDYLLKPFNFEELIARIDNLIQSRKKLIEKYTRQMYIKPNKVKAQSLDEKFLVKVSTLIETHLQDPSFGVQKLAEEVAVSEVQLFRKIKALTNQSPNEVIRNYRLERAIQLLSQKSGNVTQIAYEVGFNNLSYFAKCFREKYGCNPKEYIQKKGN